MKCRCKISLAIAIVAMSACAKTPSIQSRHSSEAVLSIDIRQERSSHKASIVEDEIETESAVKNVQLLVFDKTTGNLNAYRNLGVSTSAKLSVSKGVKVVCVALNAPSLSGISTLASLNAKKLPLVSCNGTENGFVMYGAEDCTLDKDASCTVNVKRLVSRVMLGSVSNSLPSVYGALKVQYALLGNLAPEIDFAGNVSSGSLVNSGAKSDGTADALTKSSYSDKSISAGSSSTFNSRLYGYPTKGALLVVSTQISGTTYYYPISLDNYKLTSNSSCMVNLNIVGLGSDDPSKPVVKNSLEVSVVVEPWSNGGSYSEEI